MDGQEAAVLTTEQEEVPETPESPDIPEIPEVLEKPENSDIPNLAASSSKKKRKEKHRRKNPRSWENVVKATSSLSDKDKMAYIETKYLELYNENIILSQTNQTITKEFAIVQKDRDYQQSELAKSVIARARMESLCRELQKQNKQIKEENIAKIKEEEERRKEVSSKFADKLSDINTMMDENKEKSDKLREENLKMTAKLAELYDQFQRREDDISKMSHQLELERQFSQATLAKMELEIKAEKEMHAKEQALMRNNLEKSEANCSVLMETIKSLQDHIDVYKNQYEDFETTMSKSAKVFDTFKFEIASMNKEVASLEQEVQDWKNKFHDSMKALLEVSEIKKNQEIYIQSLEKKNDQLQKLCRQIQTDRSNYLKLLKSHGIELDTNTSKEEEVKKEESPKMTKKEKELETLKDSLQVMQDELNKLTVKDAYKSEEEKTDIIDTSQITNEQTSAKEMEAAVQALVSLKASLTPSQDAETQTKVTEVLQNSEKKLVNSPADESLDDSVAFN